MDGTRGCGVDVATHGAGPAAAANPDIDPGGTDTGPTADGGSADGGAGDGGAGGGPGSLIDDEPKACGCATSPAGISLLLPFLLLLRRRR